MVKTSLQLPHVKPLMGTKNAMHVTWHVYHETQENHAGAYPAWKGKAKMT